MTAPPPAVLDVVVIGQTPPPTHGQAMAIEKFLRGRYTRIRPYHVRMEFSDRSADVGRFRIRKLLRLAVLVAKTLGLRRRLHDPVLYYPPAGGQRVPAFRDIVFLTLVRPFFRQVVFHFHATGITTLYPQLGRFGRFWFRRAYFRPDLAICLSPATQEDACALQARRTCVVAYGVEDALPTPLAGPKPAPVRLLYAGYVRETKGILVLLEAARLLCDRGLSFQLMIMGAFHPSAFEATARAQVRTAGLSDRVTFLGEQTGEAKWRAFGEAGIFCFPTHYEAEGLPLVILEAMACRLPVVATQWRGIPTLVEDGVTGFLTPPQQPAAFADRVSALIRDPALRDRMGLAGRRTYEARYTEERFQHAMEAALLSIREDGAP
jgi:glycosyltransferase involved in cell wall biosynthesis